MSIISWYYITLICIDEQVQLLAQKVDECSTKTYTKQEAIEWISDENSQLRSNFSELKQNRDKIQTKFDKVVDRNVLLNKVFKEMQKVAVLDLKKTKV